MTQILKHQLLALFAALLVATVVRASEGGKTSKTLAQLQTFPVYTGDKSEPPDERLARLTELADAIDASTTKPHERALLIAVAWHESRFARYVQLDHEPCSKGHDGRCDGGRAFGPIQLHGTNRDLTLQQQFERGLRQLRYGAAKCQGKTLEETVRGAVSLFATGSRCSWSGADARVKTWARVWGRL